MSFVNYTPFPAITWETLTPDGRELGVLLVGADLSSSPATPNPIWLSIPPLNKAPSLAKTSSLAYPANPRSATSSRSAVAFRSRQARIAPRTLDHLLRAESDRYRSVA